MNCRKRQNGCLRRPYKQLRKDKRKTKDERKDIHLNAEFQRIARRDKKTFCSDGCKEIKENNRMRKTRDFFKNIKDIMEICHGKMGTVKDGNCRT